MSKVPAVLLILILLLLAGMGYMSSRLNRILEANPAVAACLKAGRTAQECRTASDAATSASGLQGSGAATGTP